MNQGNPGDTAQHFIDTLRKSFNATWKGTTNAFEFLTENLNAQMQRIKSLESSNADLELIKQQKDNEVDALKMKLLEVHQTLTAELARKESALVAAEGKLRLTIGWVHDGAAKLHKEKEEIDEKYKEAMAEMESLRMKLKEAEERGLGQSQGNGLSHMQLAAVEAAVKKELEERSEAVSKAAAEVAKEAEAQFNEAYAASQTRVLALEEQLRSYTSTHSLPDETPETSAPPAAGHVSPAPTTSRRIITGMYRPNPPAIPTVAVNTSDSLVTPPARQSSSSNSYSPISARSPVTIPPTTASTEGVIDLTLSPAVGPEGADDHDRTPTGPVKRKRVDSDTGTPHSKSLKREETISPSDPDIRPAHGHWPGLQFHPLQHTPN